MKLIRIISFFLFAAISCISYAKENKCIFIGQNEVGDAKTVFILEMLGDDFDNYVHINEHREVYLKVDKILAVSKENLEQVAFPFEGSVYRQVDQSTIFNSWKCDCGEWNHKWDNPRHCWSCGEPR
jgi:hypothetical protein